jgi:hypothetical protein
MDIESIEKISEKVHNGRVFLMKNISYSPSAPFMVGIMKDKEGNPFVISLWLNQNENTLMMSGDAMSIPEYIDKMEEIKAEKRKNDVGMHVIKQHTPSKKTKLEEKEPSIDDFSKLR